MRQWVGQYYGQGTWHQTDGSSGVYDVELFIENLTEAGFQIRFKHEFKNSDPDVNALFEMRWLTPVQFTVLAGTYEVGWGHAHDGFCHYCAKFGEIIVEVSLQLQKGALLVIGSSNTNSAGRATAWFETLMAG